jgi:preprotein translocase subunit SecF
VLEGQKKVDEGDVRAALKQIDLEESVVQTEKSSGKEFLTIRSAPGTSDSNRETARQRISGGAVRRRAK